jgi:two-component system KDP operon response regulator KdpE
MNRPPTVLLVEDEPQARALLEVTLASQGYRCLSARTGLDGIRAAHEHEPALVLLDLRLPDLDGVEVTRRIRERSAVPIIVVSARGQEADKIAALDAGANDYVTKPFAAGELLARIRVALRPRSTRAHEPPTGTFTIGDLSIDFDTRRVTTAGKEVRLTPIEYSLLSVMVLSAGRLLTHNQILRSVWGPTHAADVNYLRVYMKKLRCKIEQEPARPRYLLNEPGVGYRLRVAG